MTTPFKGLKFSMPCVICTFPGLCTVCQKSVSCIVPLSCNTQELYQQLLWLFLMLKIILGSAGGGKYVDAAVAGQYH